MASRLGKIVSGVEMCDFETGRVWQKKLEKRQVGSGGYMFIACAQKFAPFPALIFTFKQSIL